MLLCASRLDAAPGYGITVRLDPETRTVTAHQSVRFTNDTPDTLQAVEFALSSASKCLRRRTAVSAIDRLGLPARTGDDARTPIAIDSASCAVVGLRGEDGDTATLSLAQPVPPGESATIDIWFTLRLAGPAQQAGDADPLYVLVDWHPRLVGLGDDIAAPPRADFNVELTAPARLAVIAPGGRPEADRWLALDPPVRITAGLRTLTFAASDLPAFALVAGPGFKLVPAPTAAPRVRVVCEPGVEDAWRGLAPAADSAAAAFESAYGPPPSPVTVVVDVGAFADTDTSLPGLVLLGRPGIAFTRIREARLYRQLALQWFGVLVAPDPATGAWLSDGPAVLAEIHRMADRHGRADFLALPLKLRLLDRFTTEYFHRLMHYSAATNELLEPFGSPPRRFAENTVNVAEARYSQAGLFWSALERRLGREQLDAALREYLKAGPVPDSRTIIDACRSTTGVDITAAVEPWLGTRGLCDYSVGRSGGAVRVRRLGRIAAPVDVELVYRDGTRERVAFSGQSRDTMLTLRPDARLHRATADPDRLLVEPDRWNNYWPRRITVRPVVDLPDFEAYQVFYGPYAWWDTYHGVRFGGWLNGRQFIDAGPLRGRHMWSLAETYSAGLDEWQTGFSYQTPLLAATRELRFRAEGKYAVLESDALVGLEYGLSPVFRQSGSLVRLEYQLLDVSNTRSRDTLAWQVARTSEVRFTNNYTNRTDYSLTDGHLYIGRGFPGLGDTFSYWKASLDLRQAVRVAGPVGLYARIFAGGISGDLPKQGRFYLSGGLLPTEGEPVNLGHEGWASPQEYWHFEGDANVRAWAGDFTSGKLAFAANVMLTLYRYFGVFYDIGSVGDRLDRESAPVRMDAGVRLRLGPAYADLPLWRWQVGSASEFAPKVMFGLNLSGLGDF